MGDFLFFFRVLSSLLVLPLSGFSKNGLKTGDIARDFLFVLLVLAGSTDGMDGTFHFAHDLMTVTTTLACPVISPSCFAARCKILSTTTMQTDVLLTWG